MLKYCGCSQENLYFIQNPHSISIFTTYHNSSLSGVSLFRQIEILTFQQVFGKLFFFHQWPINKIEILIESIARRDFGGKTTCQKTRTYFRVCSSFKSSSTTVIFLSTLYGLVLSYIKYGGCISVNKISNIPKPYIGFPQRYYPPPFEFTYFIKIHQVFSLYSLYKIFVFSPSH